MRSDTKQGSTPCEMEDNLGQEIYGENAGPGGQLGQVVTGRGATGEETPITKSVMFLEQEKRSRSQVFIEALTCQKGMRRERSIFVGD